MSGKTKPRKQSAADLRSPFGVEEWRSLLESLFDSEDKRDDADVFATCVFLLMDAVEKRKYKTVKTALMNAMVAAKEFGRFAEIELDYYKAYLLGVLNSEHELRFRSMAFSPKMKNGRGPRSTKKRRAPVRKGID